MKMNKHYNELKASYLFVDIAHKVAAYQEAHPEKEIIRLGIGDVTQPLAKCVVQAMRDAAEEMGTKEGFHGYGPEQGYPFLKQAIQGYYAGRGTQIAEDEIFISDGAKSDLANLLGLFDVDNTVLVPDPVYPTYVDDNVTDGRKIIYSRTGQENGFLGMPDESVKADIIYICSPNNPTGAAYTRAQLKAWVDYARKNDAIILYDADIQSDIIGRINTSERGYEALAKDINMNLGGLSSDITAISKDGKRDEFTPLMIVRAKALHSKLPDLCRLINEVVQKADYSDDRRLTELVQESKAIWDNEAFRRGNSIVSQRVMAQVSAVGKFRDNGNFGYYQKISELASNPAALPLLPEKLADVARKIFRANNVDIMFVGEEGELEAFENLMKPLIETWDTTELSNDTLKIIRLSGNDGIVTAGKVQYVAQGGNFIDHGYKHVGPMSVLETILRYEYLWIRIRVQGGAYGAFANFYDDGNMIFCSYRDPNLVETLNVYKELPQYLREFTLTDREMRKYIIGTMSSLDLPMTPALRGPRAMGMYFSGTKLEDKVEFRKQVIACKPEDIVALADVVEPVLKDNHICTMGNEQKIKDAGKVFDNIISLG